MSGPGLHSRIVTILKLGLPLIAVAMLAGLFLNSQDGRGGGELVFSPADLELLGEGMRVSRPVFSGVTDGLDRFRFTAETVTPDAAPPTRAAIQTLSGRIEFSGGTQIDLKSETADVDLKTRRMTLQGGVEAQTGDGYVFRAKEAQVDLDLGGLTAKGSVSGDGPMGRIDARSLAVSPPRGDDKARTFLFQDDVRVVYAPPAPTGDPSGPPAGDSTANPSGDRPGPQTE